MTVRTIESNGSSTGNTNSMRGNRSVGEGCDAVYTTGELAETCGTTVRTVQYYDQKGLLAPSGYSEGGRRLYTEADAEHLRFILLLKALGLKLAQIKGVLESPNRETILEALLDERRKELQRELTERTAMLQNVELLQADLQAFGHLTATSTTAMDTRMEDNRARNRFWVVMVVVGVFMDVAWIGTLIYGIVSGVWWPFPLALAFVVAAALWMVVRYDAHATYLCPVCKAEFRPKVGAFILSGHTPTTRKLTCPCCSTKDWCVERYHAEPLMVAPGECLPGTCHRHEAVCETPASVGGDAR